MSGTGFCRRQNIFPPCRINRVFSSPKRSDLLCRPFSGCFGVLSPEHEVGHSPPSSADVENEWSLTSAAPIRLYGVHRHDFAFTCTCYTCCFFAMGPYAASTRPSVPVTNCECPKHVDNVLLWRGSPCLCRLGGEKREGTVTRPLPAPYATDPFELTEKKNNNNARLWHVVTISCSHSETAVLNRI
jgi:hypothetical protein